MFCMCVPYVWVNGLGGGKEDSSKCFWTVVIFLFCFCVEETVVNILSDSSDLFVILCIWERQ